MAYEGDAKYALVILKKIQHQLVKKDDRVSLQKLNHLISVLESPLFEQLSTLAWSLDELAEIQSHGIIEKEDDFGMMPESGQLWLADEAHEKWEHITNARQADEAKANSTVRQRQALSEENLDAHITSLAGDRPVLKVSLTRQPNHSFGFSVIGLKGKKESHNLGVYIHDVVPDSIADEEGGLVEGDQLLAIDGVPLDVSTSHSDAVALLQSSGDRVQLVLARTEGGLSWTEEDVVSAVHTHGDYSALGEGEQDYFLDVVMLNTEWTQIEIIDLDNDGTGLGFGIIGSRATGVVIRSILPGGVADRDGRLRLNDHLIYIGRVNVRALSSDQVATVLRNAGDHARLIVARPFDPNTAPQLSESGQQFDLVETQRLDSQLEMIVQRMYAIEQGLGPPVDALSPPLMTPEYEGSVDYFAVDLVKGEAGLGVTIAGYLSNIPGGSLKGIFVKEISPGSAAAIDGRIQVNDKIIEVDGVSLNGFDNRQAVEILKHTGDTVHLKLARYKTGIIYEQLQAISLKEKKESNSENEMALGFEEPPYLESQPSEPFLLEVFQPALEDDTEFRGELDVQVEKELRNKWKGLFDAEVEIVVAQLEKFSVGGGLGISLEGTVDVEADGIEVRPHHYLRDIMRDGPVGLEGTLQRGDELLEVNGHSLYGLNHVDVVDILKTLPRHVRIVCARRYDPEDDLDPSNEVTHGSFHAAPVKSKSVESLQKGGEVTGQVPRARSFDQVDGLSIWASEATSVELEKGDGGMGFSVLDYQDPMNPSQSVIVVRSLVPNGIADVDGRIIPGDRLVYVNEADIENATLEEAVMALKSAPRGPVRLGIKKALPLALGDGYQDDMRQTLRSQGVIFDSDSLSSADSDYSAFSDSKRRTEQPNYNATLEYLDRQFAPCIQDEDDDAFESADDFAQIAPIPCALEQKIKIHKLAGETLGLDLEETEVGPNGWFVGGLHSGSPLDKDGRMSLGDYVTTVNSESLRDLTHIEAKAVLRRAAVISGDLSISYIPGEDARVHIESARMAAREARSTAMPPAKSFSNQSSSNRPRNVFDQTTEQ